MGLGKIAHKFAKDLKETESATLLGVASRSESKAKEFASQYQSKWAYGSYEDLLDNKEIDIIYVATPHSHHYENVMMCFDAGKNVLCEKAFAVNAKQVRAMVDKARQEGLFLMEGMWSRFNPALQDAKNDIESGLIGTLQAVKADFCFHQPYDLTSRLCNKKLAGGALLDIGIYPIFLSYYMLGKPVRMNVEAEYYPNGTDKNLVMLFDYENGREAILNCSLQYFSPCDGFLYGENGCIRIHGRWHEANTYTRFVKSMDFPVTKGYGHKPLSFKFEIEEVNSCLLNGQLESKKWTLQNSIELMEILDEVRSEIKLDYGGLEAL